MKKEKQLRALEIIACGKYAATTKGSVVSLYDAHGNPRKHQFVLKVAKLPKGYEVVTICMDSAPLQLLVHQFVWLYFKGAIPAGLQLNHKNAVKSDNRICNLELVTGKENVRHAIGKGLIKSGEGHYLSKLTCDAVRDIRARVLAGCQQTALAKEYMVSKGTVRDVVQYKTWRNT